MKAQEQAAGPQKSIYPTGEEDKGEDGDEPQTEPASLDLHPQRQALLEEEPPAERTPKHPQSQADGPRRRERKPKRSAYTKELEIAEKRKKEAEAKKAEREFRQKDREAMARARRPDQFGKRRLGRESKVLLGRVQRMVGPA